MQATTITLDFSLCLRQNMWKMLQFRKIANVGVFGKLLFPKTSSGESRPGDPLGVGQP